jgi:putative transcriptional regulator
MSLKATLPADTKGSLAGHLLIATAVVQDSCFARSVIYLCAHNETGAMGIIVNYPVENIGIRDIFEQLEIHTQVAARDIPIHFGGPVEANRGFVVHTSEYGSEDSLISKDGIAVTASISVLEEMAQGTGPAQGMLVLGYAGWSPGQLEAEIEGGSWIVVPASRELVFASNNEGKWNSAVATLGIDMGHFSTVVGHA